MTTKFFREGNENELTRPDQSYYLAHFTKNGREYDPSGDRINPSVAQMSAIERLVHILEEKKINATNMNWTNQMAVCFTECPWGSLLRHAENYSCYGIGFTKKLVFSRGGNPVIYANPNMFDAQHWAEEVYPFVTPFVPSYAPDSIKRHRPFRGKTVDYSQEREWRVAKDFPFSYRNIQFVVLDKISDLQMIPQGIIEEIGVEKFLFMDTYRKIEELWPTHLME